MPKKRILFFGEETTLAHIVRPLVLAESLDPGKYEVSFAAGGHYQNLLAGKNFTFHKISSISPDTFLRRLAEGKPLYRYSELKNYVESDIETISKVSPDVIIGDFRLSLGISADLMNIPFINLTNAHWTPHSKQKFPVPDLGFVKLLGTKLSGLFINPILPLIFRHHAQAFNRLRKENRLEPLGDMKEVYTHGTWTLLVDTPSLGPTSNLPGNHHYIGPILWSPKIPLPTWFNDLPKKEKIIYATLGSSGKISLVDNILSALEKTPFSAIIATAGRVPDRRLPENCWSADYLPAMDILDHSALAICNGGSATAYQALAKGVPVLGFPSNADQFFTMSSISSLGAGEMIRPENANINTIVKFLNQIIKKDTYRNNAVLIAEEFKKHNAPERFNNFLNSVVFKPKNPNN